MFRYSTLSGWENAPVLSGSELIEIVRRRPVWDELTITREDDAQFPRASLSWHEGRGLVVHCFEDEPSWGFFLAESAALSEPEVDIVLGGQVQERWPRQLFVDPSLGVEAIDYFLETGKQKETLHWIRTDAFPRTTVMGRASWPRVVGEEAGRKGTNMSRA